MTWLVHGRDATRRLLKALVPNLGINYPRWVMGPFDLGNGQFFFN